VVNTIAMVYATSKTFFRSPCYAKDSNKSIVKKQHLTETKQSLFTNYRRSSGYKQKQGALHVFSLTLKPHGYKLRGVLDASPSYFLCLRDGPLHHWL
jgi:hypothetical protein